MWPGIFGNYAGSNFTVSQMRKRAVQASRFMLQMVQIPLYVKEAQPDCESTTTEQPQVTDKCAEVPFDCGEEGLALRIAVEVIIHKFEVIYCTLILEFCSHRNRHNILWYLTKIRQWQNWLFRLICCF